MELLETPQHIVEEEVDLLDHRHLGLVVEVVEVVQLKMEKEQPLAKEERVVQLVVVLEVMVYTTVRDKAKTVVCLVVVVVVQLMFNQQQMEHPVDLVAVEE